MPSDRSTARDAPVRAGFRARQLEWVSTDLDVAFAGAIAERGLRVGGTGGDGAALRCAVRGHDRGMSPRRERDTARHDWLDRVPNMPAVFAVKGLVLIRAAPRTAGAVS